MRLSIILRVCFKEALEAVRDRNFIVNVVLIPLFLFPVIGFGVMQVIQIQTGAVHREIMRVAVGPGVPGAVRDSLEAGDRLELVEAPAVRDDSPAGFRAWRETDEVDLLVAWGGGGTAPDTAHIWHDASRERSEGALGRTEVALADWERARALERMGEAGLGERDLGPFDIESEDLASAEQRGQEVLAAILPMILLMMLATGTYYAALDTIVGERERGTWETILVSPLSRGEVLTGKYLFVVGSAVTALVLNLASMAVFLSFVLKLLGDEFGEEIRLAVPPGAIALVVAGALATALFFSALVMLAAATARTYREGQAVLGPFYIVAMLPGIAVAVSRDPFGMAQALVPMLNSAAMFKSVLSGEMPVGPILVTIAVLLAGAAIVLAFASRVASRDDIFVAARLSWKELLRS